MAEFKCVNKDDDYWEAIDMIGKESTIIYNNTKDVCPDIHNPYVRIYYNCKLEDEPPINLGTTRGLFIITKSRQEKLC